MLLNCTQNNMRVSVRMCLGICVVMYLDVWVDVNRLEFIF